MKKLTAAQAARALGIQRGSFSGYVSRGFKPQADDHADPCGCPWWLASTLLTPDSIDAGLAKTSTMRVAAVRADLDAEDATEAKAGYTYHRTVTKALAAKGERPILALFDLNDDGTWTPISE